MLRDLSYKAMTRIVAEPPFASSYFSTFLERRKGLAHKGPWTQVSLETSRAPAVSICPPWVALRAHL